MKQVNRIQKYAVAAGAATTAAAAANAGVDSNGDFHQVLNAGSLHTN
jgi:hypothetical protein